MRIGIDGRCLLEVEPTGVSWYAFNVIQQLAKLYPEQSFMIFVSGLKAQSSFIDQLVLLPNIVLKHLRIPNKLFHAVGLVSTHFALDYYLKNIDVLFVPNLHILPLRTNVPVVLTVHDLSFKLYPEFLSQRRRLWHQVVQPEKLFVRANKIIAVSNITKQDLVSEYPISNEKIQVVHSAMPELAVAEPLANLPQRYAVVMSTLEPRKNILAIVQAFELFCKRYSNSKLELVLIGGTGWKSQAIMDASIHNARVHYYGYVTPGQKVTALQNAQALFYPSIYEGFGLPPLEALSLHVPVVASHTGALPEVLGNAAYYVDPYSMPDLVEAFRVMDVDEIFRQRLITAGQVVQQRYSWEKTARETFEVLQGTVR